MMPRLLRTVVAMTVLATLLPVALFGDMENTDAQSAGMPMELNMMGIYLSEQMGLSPLPPDTNEYQSISIPNGFIKDGLFGYSILPIGHLYWKDVGVWETSPLRETINLGGDVGVTIFATREEGAGNVNCDFYFYIMRGTEVLLKLESMDRTIQNGIDNRVDAYGRFPANNDTTIEAGTKLSLMIQARCNGGAIMKFGSTEVPSGFTFASNSLQLQNIFMDREKITVEYKDAFMVPWIELYTELRVDGVIHPNEQMMSQVNSINRTREIIWERDNPPANYEVFISMSYHYAGIYNISEIRTISVHKPHISTLDTMKDILGQAFVYLLLGAFIILGIVLLSRYRKGVWRKRFKELPLHMQELTRHKKKKEWKRSHKQLKKEGRQGKREEKERKKNEDDGEFSLFKRKDRAPSRSEKATSIALTVETAEEIEL
ncbi:MAG: hypothetical protein JXA22_09455 [Candidatus Thermoplasmatota archaeon]|nr:hypothetical protein [Candidatus Thermoplasmatota archaeon]